MYMRNVPMYLLCIPILQEDARKGSRKPMEAWSKQNTYKILRAEI